jgi:outer membrane receptor protein involved in Fe transport
MVESSSGNPLVRVAVRAVIAGSTAVATLSIADAQEAATGAAPKASEAPQEVVVTGSRIAVPNQVSISPVTAVSAATLQASGTTRVEDLLNELPQVFAAQSATVVNGADGTAQVDLRGLGAKRTLVLVNGLRLGPGDPRTGGASDVNMIPVPLIDSIEILTGGASSVYGADAVSGVVNFKLNDHFEGVRLVLNGSFYDHDNTNTQNVITDLTTYNTNTGNNFKLAPNHVDSGTNEDIAFIAGLNTGDGKGNATFYTTFRNVAAVLQSEYSVSACSLSSGYLPPHPGATGNFSCGGSSTSFPGRFIDPAAAKPHSSSGDTLAAGNTLVPYTSAAAFNFGPLNYYSRPDQNYTAGAFLHYDFNEHATVYSSTMFMDDRSIAQIAPSGAFLQGFKVNCDNPFLSASELSIWCAGAATPGTSANILIGRRNVEGGNRQDDLEHTDWRTTIGVEGKIDDAWKYDASYQYSIVNLEETYYNDVSITKAGYALNAVNTANGPQCGVIAADAAAKITPSGLAVGCVPWDIFQLGGVTSAATAYLNTPGVQRGQLKQTVVNANFTGDLGLYGLQLPTAQSGLLVNVGGEYRDERSFTITDEEFQSGDLAGQGGPRLPVAGGLIAREGFMEAHLPIADNQPFAKTIAFETGYRYSAYSQGFNTDTYKFGVEWVPLQDYRLRGSYSRAVRAPNISELFATQAVVLDGTIDPCAGPVVAATGVLASGYTPAQCAQAKVTAAQYGNVLPNPAAQYNGLRGGNPRLLPETALTSSFGLGWTPSYLPGLRAQFDYYNIKIENIIRGIGANTILTECLKSNLFCNLITRDQYGTLWLSPAGFITDTLKNVGQLQEKGVDVDIEYKQGLGTLGKLSTSVQGTYIKDYIITPISAFPASAFNCAGYYGPNCSATAGGPVFRWRHTLRATWATPWAGLDLGVAWRYFSSATLDSLNPNPNLYAGTVASGKVSNTDASIASFSYIDLTASWKVNENLSLRLGCNNVMDKSPPVIGATNLSGGNGNTYPQFYDALGRYIFAQAIVQF